MLVLTWRLPSALKARLRSGSESNKFSMWSVLKRGVVTASLGIMPNSTWLSRTFRVEYFQKKGTKWHLNILYNDEFLGFLDPKMDRTKRNFVVKNLVLKRELRAGNGKRF